MLSGVRGGHSTDVGQCRLTEGSDAGALVCEKGELVFSPGWMDGKPVKRMEDG